MFSTPTKIGRLGKMGIYQRSFSVTSMSPALWLDAADTLSIIDDAGAVTQWKDKSGNAKHFTQNTELRKPQTGSETMNSKNVLTFDGDDDQLLGEHIYGLYDGLSAFIVTNSKCSEKTSGYNFAFAINGAGWLANDQNAPSLNFSSVVSQANWQIGSIAESYTGATEEASIHFCTSDGENVVYYANGDILKTETMPTPAIEGSIGSYIGGVGETSCYKGDIAEIILFDRILSNMENNRIGRYLSKKWGTPWTDV